ncbi:sodium/potassium/calcium exchanger 2-like isoform X3 [Nelusetta ayraudi]|uniref:sodium/potassium/calcium exchanger 2-like isoform X3 n=1 Tax=Nelusetta ayraudi TaxID=303726 RepID=UPI003F718ED6
MIYADRETLFLITGAFLCSLLQPTCGGDLTDGAKGATAETTVLNEPLTATHEEKIMTPDMLLMHNTDSPPKQTVVHHISEVPETPSPAPPVQHIDYPSDLFSIDDLRRGWVILHMFGMVYMFISLAIVCKEFFVPSLWVIQDRLAISDDVTGATFMAVGRTVPRHLSLLIGAFLGPSNVGFGSIVGAAVYKILFVIGVSALFSRRVLHLTKWPFFRDVSFYLLSLVLLIIFFLDNIITWWESMMLVTVYILYVIFLKFNVQVEQALKTRLHKHENSIQVVEPETAVMSAASGVAEGPERDEDVMKRGEQEGKGEALSLKWPETLRKQAVFLFLLPITFPLWLTLPDVRHLKSERLVAVTFLGCIVWIHIFSYFMLWWAHRAGETFSIPETIIGLTVLAVGTSIPDLIASGIVARRGRADMLVSSSAGCNIFDITVGMHGRKRQGCDIIHTPKGINSVTSQWSAWEGAALVFF